MKKIVRRLEPSLSDHEELYLLLHSNEREGMDICRKGIMAPGRFPSEAKPLNDLAAQGLLDRGELLNKPFFSGTQQPFIQIQGSAYLPTLFAFPVIRDTVKETVRVVI